MFNTVKRLGKERELGATKEDRPFLGTGHFWGQAIFGDRPFLGTGTGEHSDKDSEYGEGGAEKT
jgi:hypothetical protein